MFISRRSNNLMNWIHKSSPWAIYNNTSSTFQELLQRNKSFSVHHKNIQTLTAEVFRVVNNICPPILKTLFDFRENRYNTRTFQEMRQQEVRTVRYGLETAFYQAHLLWSLVPADLKPLPTECPCKLYKTYLKYIGYV